MTSDPAALLDLVADSAAALCWIERDDGGLVHVAPVGKHLGLPADGLRRDGWSASVHPDDLARLPKARQDDVELRLRDRRGLWRRHALRMRRLARPGEEVVWLGVARDVERERQL